MNSLSNKQSINHIHPNIYSYRSKKKNKKKKKKTTTKKTKRRTAQAATTLSPIQAR
jgi:hypothetical protein